MSEPGGRPANPFESLPLWSQLAGRPPAPGPVDWEVAHAVAAAVAGAMPAGAGTAPVDPDVAAHWAALARVAELHLAAVAPGASEVVGVAPVAPVEWAQRSLELHRGLLEALARALTPADEAVPPGEGPPPSAVEGLVFGWMFGQQARRSFGQYELPLPAPATGSVLVVPGNAAAFADEWQLPGDDVGLWVCLHQLAHAAVLGLPHVRHRLEVLVARHAIGFRVDPSAFADEIDQLDPDDHSSFRRVLGEPEDVVSAVSTPEQLEARAELDALVAALEGWVDHVVAAAGRPLLGAHDPIAEAVRRRRAETSWGERFGARMLGLELRPSTYERGRAFVDGVVTGAGEDALGRLWASEDTLPAPAEVDAPGLWLARQAF
ncbi:MAG: zinc-dependent metalloprotease [Actinomycetota bacterium]|nr:zinc-dependent metalloprotease [Actinomycetota bacterium]